MNCNTHVIRSGYDHKKCFVHARCCYTPEIMVMTAQYLDVDGCDLFSGIYMSTSKDEGQTWSPLKAQEGLAPIVKDGYTIVGCDGTPMHHQKTDTILLLGHTAEYAEGGMMPIDRTRRTFYSVYDKDKDAFGNIQFLEMPKGYESCGNGSGQSIELANGDILIPVYYKVTGEKNMYSTVLRCAFDGEQLQLLEMGNALTVQVERGLYEPSLVCHNSIYYLTMRNDECGFVAKSEDGLHYSDLQLWRWEDGSLLDNYNTQQHWMQIAGELYLVYTRRGADNDHVFRHRAPLFAARVENMRLVRDSEFVVVKERGARLGNFGVTSYKDDQAVVMAAEWMQPRGCEKYGSDNSIFISYIQK